MNVVMNTSRHTYASTLTQHTTSQHDTTPQHTATHYNALLRAATHHNTLQHTKQLQYEKLPAIAPFHALNYAGSGVSKRMMCEIARAYALHDKHKVFQCVAACFSALQCVAVSISKV